MNPRNNLVLLFVQLSCFLTHTNAQLRITDGGGIPIERRPHAVAIFHIETYICVGSLVNLQTVVTVAHCVKPLEQSNLRLLAGATNTNALNTERGQTRGVVHIYYGPGYNPVTRYMDVAVLKADSSFHRTGAVRTILLCNDRLVPDLPMQISGWGPSQVNRRDHSPLLLTKSVRIVNTQQCKHAYAIARPQVYLAETIICAGSSTDVCFGDAGAAGVVSHRLCALVQGDSMYPDLPLTYTDVSNLRVKNFIRSKML